MAAGAARVGLADGVVVVGLALSVYGVSRLSLTAALILTGAALVTVGVLLAWRHG